MVFMIAPGNHLLQHAISVFQYKRAYCKFATGKPLIQEAVTFGQATVRTLHALTGALLLAIAFAAALRISQVARYKGLQNEGEEITGFELGNDQHEFHPVRATFGKDQHCIVLIVGNQTNTPAIRYCFKNYQVGSVKNSSGLPLIPFRTDQWAE